MNRLKNIIRHTALLLLACLAVTGCYDDNNDWKVDESYDGLFRTLAFEVTQTGATSVTIKFNKVVKATRYIFEFAEDNLEFREIVKTDIILADTITPYSTNSNATKVEYRVKFTDLNSSTLQSVRMKAVDDINHLESAYVETVFETSAENIFTTVNKETSSLTFNWEQTPNVTHIVFGKFDTSTLTPGDGEEEEEEEREDTYGMSEIQRIDLTEQQISDATLTVSGLQSGTTYKAIIYNDIYKRGEQRATTSGTVGGHTYSLNADEDIVEVLEELLSQNIDNVILNFDPAQEYLYDEKITVPAGIKALTLTGGATISLRQIEVKNNDMSAVLIQNINIIATHDEYLININDGTVKPLVDKVGFSDAYIKGHRSAVYIGSGGATTIEMENTIVEETGGYGVFNCGGSGILSVLSVQNTTFINAGTQLLDIRVQVSYMVFSYCTVYNSTKAISQYFRFNNANTAPIVGVFNRCIFSGNNNGSKPNGFYQDIDAYTFGSCYKTGDFEFNNAKRAFPDINEFSGTAYDIFVDPDNGDFTLIDGVGFGGYGVAGDTRWWSKESED